MTVRPFHTLRRRRFDGHFNRASNTLRLPDGLLLGNLHLEAECEGRPCVIHNLSQHAMRKFPLHWRQAMPWDIKPAHFERICPHGVGHPDPDDLSYWITERGDTSMAVHGCDGCCTRR